jgi:hypothetical protein
MNTQTVTVIHSRIRVSVKRIGRRVIVDGNRFDAALEGVELDSATRPHWETIPQLAGRHPAFSEAAIRQLIARAEKGGQAEQGGTA